MNRTWIVFILLVALAGCAGFIYSCGGGGGQTSLLIFAADMGNGRELWTYDGSSSPQMIDIDAVTNATPGPFATYRDKLYFRGDDGTHGIELMVYDGMSTPVVAANLGTPDPAGSDPGSELSETGDMVVYQNKLYFSSNYWSKLMVFDGVNAPSLVSTSVVSPFNITEYDGKLYFRAADTSGDIELWSFDGVTASIAASINPTGHSQARYLTEFDGKLYFSAADSGINYELWCYDNGSAWMVTDINGTLKGSNPEHLKVYNGRLYFSADDGSGASKELWVHEAGTSSAEMVTDIYPGGGSYPATLTLFDGKLFFTGYNGSIRTLWALDGGSTVSSVSGVGDMSTSSARGMAVYKGKLYFPAEDVDHGFELWSYDGTSPPSMVEDLYTGTDDSYPVRFYIYTY